ncbi:MAG: calcium-binding protein [Methylococcaceae bacterium]|jgi:Ca2+-binding RTX toxin-like protein
MSTQSGGAALAASGVIFDTNNTVVQAFFSNPNVGTIVPTSATPVETGVTQYTTSTGEVITMVGDNYLGSSIKLENSGSAPIVGAGADSSSGDYGQVVVGTGNGIEIIGSSGANNVFFTDDAYHSLLGKGGADTIQNAGVGGGYYKGDAGNDTMIGGEGSEWFEGGTGKDLLIGGGGNDVLYGNQAADDINGGSGQDNLYGGQGNDALRGGTGNDILTGGSGKDIFIFEVGNTGNDNITDFKKGDILDLAQRGVEGTNFTITQEGKDTVIDFKNGDKITLQKVKADKLHDDDGDGLFTL